MYEDNDLKIAVNALEKLEGHHFKFIAALNKSNTEEKPGIGEISIIKDVIIFACLNYKVALKHRCVVSGGRLSSIQYRFCVTHKDEEVPILTLYHQANGELTEDLEAKNKVCDYNNTYVATLLMNEVGKKLLLSSYFAP